MRISRYLNLDVTPALDVPLDINPRIAKRGHRFGLRRLQNAPELLGFADDLDSLPASSGGCLHDHRQTDLIENPGRRLRIVEVPVDWQESEESRLTPLTPFSMVVDLLKLRWNDLLGRYRFRWSGDTSPSGSRGRR